MQRKYTNCRYLDAVNDRVIIFDGAMGTSLQSMDLTAVDFGGEKTNGCNDYLVISNPEVVKTVHRSFYEAGVDVVETDTFRSNRLTLAEYGLSDRVLEINKTAAELARSVADEFEKTSGQERFVAGAIGPTGKLPSMDDPELSNVSFDELVDIFREQALGLIQGGVDVLLIETSQDILEVKAAILGCQTAFEESGVYLPIQAQVTLDITGRMLLGTDINAALVILESLPIDVIGLNCSTGPEHMREPIRFLGETTRLPVSCIPNAGLPLNVDGEAVYPLGPDAFAEAMGNFVENNHISVVGGCCGTTPAHLKKLVEKVGGKKHPPRPILDLAQLTSSVQAMNIQQEPAPFLIGERLNTQGSRKFKQLILDEDYDRIIGIAQQQMDSGAHGLDICVALTERQDEAETIRKVIKKLAPIVKVPLVIDTTELDVLEMALKTTAGRCLINSTNLESGEEKAKKVFALAKKYNAAVIILTIDEKGMAKTADQKLAIARRLVKLAEEEYGLKPSDLVVDALVFTLATGSDEFKDSALETINGIRLIKQEIPGIFTSLGVSNVSFGLTGPARAVINSVFLFHCVQAGLDMAIVNPAQITPYAEIPEKEKQLAEELIFNKHPEALQNLVAYFEEFGGSKVQKASQTEELLKTLNTAEKLHWRIVHRVKDDVELDIDALLAEKNGRSQNEQAVFILNQVLLPAMKEVGDKFGSGELILPFVLQSAEVMKKAVAYLENFLEKKEGVSKGLMVLATVYGDVHDIGKNLVKTILVNNGYDVIDLGKQVPAETIIQKAVEVNADAIGLSALLVSTSKQMPLIVNELHRRKINIPVLIGGAAINRRFGRRILLTDQDEFYDGGVFYCKDAFEGLAVMDQLSEPDKKQAFTEKNRTESTQELERVENAPPKPVRKTQHTALFPPAEFIPSPPGWGAKIVESMPLENVFQHLSKNELFRLSWGAKNARGEEWKKIKADFEERLVVMKKEASKTGWLKPQGVYGFFPAQADGDRLLIYDPVSMKSDSPSVMQEMIFPRQNGNENLCLADYFSPIGSGKMDVAAFQVVTVGQEATRLFDEKQKNADYSEAYFMHGLAVQTAEAAAEYLHRHLLKQLGVPEGQGKRYSWGYPAIPELEDHTKVFKLLPVEEALGMSLTEAYQLVPEQSTAAIIVHHPLAKYFHVGGSRVDQLMNA